MINGCRLARTFNTGNTGMRRKGPGTVRQVPSVAVLLIRMRFFWRWRDFRLAFACQAAPNLAGHELLVVCAELYASPVAEKGRTNVAAKLLQTSHHLKKNPKTLVP